MYPVLSEVMLFAPGGSYGWAQGPRGWTACDGKTMRITSNNALFETMHATYGGDGRNDFKVPHLNAESFVTGWDGKNALKFFMATEGAFPSTGQSNLLGDVGMIKMLAGTRPQGGWVNCDGQELSIASHQALFDTIGAKYGGDGTTTFALPKLNSTSLSPNGKAQKFVIATKTIGDDSDREPYYGQVVLFGGDTPPSGWVFCDGAEQSIDGNSALFSLIGTSYGGNGRQTFALPNLNADAVNEGTVAPKLIISTEGLYPSRP